MFDDNLGLSLNLSLNLCWPDWELFRVLQSVARLGLQYQSTLISSFI